MKALFDDLALRDVFAQRKEALRKAVDTVPAEQMRADDEGSIVSQLIDAHAVSPIQLTEGAISAETEDSLVYVSGSWEEGLVMPMPEFRRGVRVTYYVPFTGDEDLLRPHSDRYSLELPPLEIRLHELVFRFTDPDSNVAETKPRFDETLRDAKDWVIHVNQEVARFNQTLRASVAQLVAERRGRLRQMAADADSLGIPIRSKTASAFGPQQTLDPLAAQKHYDVALSFAGEDRAYVEQVAEALTASGVRVFYDAYETVDLWGKNLVDHLAEVYQKRSRFVVMFISKYYVQKAWPTHERRHAQSRELLAKEEYILPARFDATEVPGMTQTVAYVDLREVSPKQLAAMIKGKLR